MEPTYLIWTPRAWKDRPHQAVRFNVTPLSALDWPTAGEAFYSELLSDIGVRAGSVSWDVLPYRSRYHGDPDAADWEDRWKRNWRVEIALDEQLVDLPAFEEGYETQAFAAADPLPDGNALRALVLADFRKKEDAEEAVAEIRSLARTPVDFELFSVEGAFWQLQIDLGAQPVDSFRRPTQYADRIENACRTAGGWPTFNERVQALG